MAHVEPLVRVGRQARRPLGHGPRRAPRQVALVPPVPRGGARAPAGLLAAGRAVPADDGAGHRLSGAGRGPASPRARVDATTLSVRKMRVTEHFVSFLTIELVTFFL